MPKLIPMNQTTQQVTGKLKPMGSAAFDVEGYQNDLNALNKELSSASLGGLSDKEKKSLTKRITDMQNRSKMFRLYAGSFEGQDNTEAFSYLDKVDAAYQGAIDEMSGNVDRNGDGKINVLDLVRNKKTEQGMALQNEYNFNNYFVEKGSTDTADGTIYYGNNLTTEELDNNYSVLKQKAEKKQLLRDFQFKNIQDKVKNNKTLTSEEIKFAKENNALSFLNDNLYEVDAEEAKNTVQNNINFYRQRITELQNKQFTPNVGLTADEWQELESAMYIVNTYEGYVNGFYSYSEDQKENEYKGNLIQAQMMYDKTMHPKIGNVEVPGLKLTNSVTQYLHTGLDNYFSSIMNIGKTPEEIKNEVPNAFELTSSAIREHYQNKGDELAIAVQDIVTNIGQNMVPMALGLAGGGVFGKIGGTVASTASFAPSVFGNAYEEGIREGITDMGKLMVYATATTVVECGLQYAFDSVAHLDGGAVTNKISNAISQKVTSAVGKAVIKTVSAGAGEFIEEATQEILNPLFKKWFLGVETKNILNDTWGSLSDAAYAGIIGFASSIFMGGALNFENAKIEANIQQVGKQYNAILEQGNIDIKEVAQFILEVSDSKQLNALAEKIIQGDVSDLTVGEFYAAVINYSDESANVIYEKIGESLRNEPEGIENALKVYEAHTEVGAIFPENVVALYNTVNNDIENCTNVELGEFAFKMQIYSPRAHIVGQLNQKINEDEVSNIENESEKISDSASLEAGSTVNAEGEVFRTPETKEIYTKNEGLLDDGLNPHQRYIKNISEKFGIRLLWDKTGKVKTGKYNSQTKTIILNPNMGTGQMYMFVFKHEFTHWLADRKGFQNVKNYLLNKSGEFYNYALEQCEANGIEHGAGREDVISAYCNYLFDTYKNSDELSAYEKSIFTLESAQEEAVANFVAKKLFGGIETEEGYRSLMSLKNENKGIIQTFIDFIKHLKNKFFGDKRTRTLGEDLDYIEERLQQVLLSKEKATTEAVAEKHYVKKDSQGNEYWQIESGQDIFKGIKNKEKMRDKAYEYLIKNRDNKVVVKDENGREIVFIRLSAEEFTQSEESRKLFKENPELFNQKMRLIPSLQDILINSNVNWQSPDHKNHKLFKDNGFENYRGKVGIDNVIFNTVVRVGKANFGNVFYDINLEVDSYLPHTKSASDINESTSFNNRIPQNESTVNNNIYTESEIDTESNKNYIPADSFGVLMKDFTEGKITEEEFNEKAMELDKKRQKALETKYRNKYRTERESFKPYRGSIADLQRIGKKLKKSVGSNYDEELLVNELGALMSIADSKNLDYELLSRASRQLAENIVAYKVPILSEETKEILNVIKSLSFHLNPGQIAEIENVYGSVGKFKKEFRGVVSIIDDAPTLDSVWGELATAYPWVFDESVSDAQMPIALIEKIESLQNTFEEFEDSADTIIRVYNDIMTETFHSRRAAYEDDRKTLGARTLAQTREEYRIEREAADKRHSSIYSIQRSVKKLDRMARKATNSNHLPESLRETIQYVVDTFLKNPQGIFSEGELRQIRVYYSECLQNTEIGKYMNDDLIGEIKLLENILDGKSILELNQNALDMVGGIVDYFNVFVTAENEAFIEKRQQELEERANKAVSEIEESKGFLANHEEKNAQKILDTLGINNREAYYVFKQLGGEFEKLYWRLVEGGNRFSTYCEKFSCFTEKVKDEYKYNSWKDKIITVNIKGKEIKLTVEEALSVYAMAQREKNNRYEHQKHLIKGGLVFKVEELRKALTKEIKSPAKRRELLKELKKGATQVDDSDINRIVSQIPEEALKYANSMIEYISTECARQGNDVSMELYNYKKYREGFYFPFQVAEEYLETQEVKKTREEKLKAPSFTHSLQVDAVKPLAVRGFSTVVAEHVEKMANHNAAASAMTDLINLLNFTTEDGSTVKKMIEDKFGSGVLDYIADFVDDMNGGYVKDSRAKGIAKFANNTKKARVLGNLSVIVQQPHAINRATAEIDYKYLMAAPKYKATWNEIKRYAPVAIIKEKGRYDIGLGVKNQDWLLSQKPEGFVDKVNDFAGKGPGSADKVAWWYLYKAVKAEIANTTELEIDSEEFNKAVGKRFTEIVYKTQVFDSTLTKSGNMRSQDSMMQAATVYMAEPTKQVNVLLDAINDVKNGKKGANKKIGRVVRGFLIEATFNAAFVALIRGVLRDDDEDESLIEKYLASFVDVFRDNVNPLSKIPFMKDVLSLTEGWSVERLEFEGIADVIKEIGKFQKALENKNLENVGGALWDLGLKISTFAGLPFESVERDIKGVFNLFKGNDNPTTATGVKMALAEVFGTVEKDADRYRKLYEAAESGDQKEFQSIYKYLKDERGKSDSSIQSGLLAISKEKKNVKKEVKAEVKKLQSSDSYEMLSPEHKSEAEKDIEKYIALEEKVDTTDGAKNQYVELFKLKEKYGAKHQKYKEAYEKLLKAGKTEKQIRDGLLVGEMAYIESLGVDISKYILFKYAKKVDYADKDNSGGVSKKEKYTAVDNLDVDKKAKEKLKGLI